MTVIWLNGAVGSGNSAVGAALAALLPRGGFVQRPAPGCAHRAAA